jgi:thymidylate synthase
MMYQYLKLLEDIMGAGEDYQGRNGDCRSLHGQYLNFHMDLGFPAVTTKKLAFNQVKAELLWFLSGSTDIRDLWKNNTHIWDGNYYDPSWQYVINESPMRMFFDTAFDTGRIYSYQWRSWDGTVDQIHTLVQELRNNPYSRRHVVSAWNPCDLRFMCLPPCHINFICNVTKSGKLDMSVTMRSCDVFLGLPFNIASYGLLLHILAQCTNLIPGQLSIFIADAHIYHSHFDAVRKQLSRTVYSLPRLELKKDLTDIFEFTMNDIKLKEYTSHPAIKAEMVV